MSRFDADGEDGMPWELWETVVSKALGGRRGQEAMAAMEEALLALPEPKLIQGHLAYDGAVCAVGALVAHRRATEQGVDIATVLDAMSVGVKCWCGHGHELHDGDACSGKRWQDAPCSCAEYEPDTEDIYETTQAGKAAGLSHTLAWHLAYLNDEEWRRATDGERYALMLSFARRAQGKEAATGTQPKQRILGVSE